MTRGLSVEHISSRVLADGAQVALIIQDGLTRLWDVHASEGTRQGAMIAESCGSYDVALTVAENYARREGLID